MQDSSMDSSELARAIHDVAESSNTRDSSSRGERTGYARHSSSSGSSHHTSSSDLSYLETGLHALLHSRERAPKSCHHFCLCCFQALCLLITFAFRLYQAHSRKRRDVALARDPFLLDPVIRTLAGLRCGIRQEAALDAYAKFLQSP